MKHQPKDRKQSDQDHMVRNQTDRIHTHRNHVVRNHPDRNQTDRNKKTAAIARGRGFCCL